MAAAVPRAGPEGYAQVKLVAQCDRWSLHRAMRERDQTPVLLKIWRAPYMAQDLGQQHNEHLVLTHLRGNSSAIALVEAPQTAALLHLVFADFAAVPLQDLPLPLSLEAFFDVAGRCAEAVRNLHASGVVHKNIRPAHMLRDAHSGSVKLMNFGIASLLLEPHQGATRQGMVEGALAYLPPEQTGRLTIPIDFRADLYALGCTFYEWLTGHPPFCAQNILAWIRLHLAETPISPTALRPECPSALAGVVLKLLEKTTDDRYQSAAGLLHDLQVCAGQWAQTGAIGDFTLGTQDSPERFFLPQRLYGRRAQAGVLEAALQAAQDQAQPQVVLVHGEAGIGKTALVESLYKPLVRQRGYFVGGKFDPYEQNKPYAGLSSALADLLHQVLTEPPEILDPWQQRARATLGGKAALLADVVPGIEVLLGDTQGLPSAPPMDAGEARQARRGALKQWVAMFASAQHPLVIFLDDLQWSDGASLDLLQELGTSAALSLVLILAYRSNEVDEAHPAHAMLSQLRAARANIQDIDLPPLDASALTALVQEATGAAQTDAAQLAAVLTQKTAGNPFFAREFLLCLWHQKILTRKQQGWHWDLAHVARLEVSANLADMLAGRLRALPPLTQQALKAASCLGSRVDVATLARALDIPQQHIEKAVQEAVQRLLVLPLARTSDVQCYRFAHDRIQQAAAQLCDLQTAQLTHRRVGLHLLAELPPVPSARQIFATVNHLNAVQTGLDDPEADARLQQLNVAAGFEAKAACAFAAAQEYFTRALVRSASASDFETQLALAEVQYAQHAIRAAEATLGALLRQVTQPAHRARIYALWLRMLRTSERSADALAYFRTWYTELLGVLPEESDVFGAIVAEQEAVTAYLQGRPPEAFLDLPQATDPMGEASSSFLREAATALIMASPPMCLLVALKIITLAMRYGNSPPSCYGYSAYGMALSAFFSNATAGLEFVQVAARLAEQLQAKRAAAHALMMLGSINSWKNPPDSSVPIFERAMHLFGEVGDFEYAAFCGMFRSWAVTEKGATIDVALQACRIPLALMHKHSLQTMEAAMHQEIAALQALTDEHASPSGTAEKTASFSEAIALFDQQGFRLGSASSHVFLVLRHAIYWEFDIAQTYANAVDPLIASMIGHSLTALYYFYRGVLEAQLCRHPASTEGQARLATLDLCCCKMEAWAAHSAGNFLHRAQLLRAEQHRLRGEIVKALGLYEQSLQSIRRTHSKALLGFACELVGRNYLSFGADEMGYHLLRKARFAYAQWGAMGKVAQLDRIFPMLQEQFEAENLETTAVKRVRHLDWQSIVKATQTISSEMAPARLMPMLLEVVRESAGAQRACILLAQGEQLWLEADLSDTGQKQPCRVKVDEARTQLCTAVVNYVQRTRKTVILDDARANSIFSRDAYIIEKQPKSLLCMPITRHGILQGLLYLENNTMTSAFNADRAAVLEVIASQVAISIDNARLYVDAQSAIRDRESFLGIAAHELKTPLTSLQLQADGMVRLLRKQDQASVDPKLAAKVERAMGQIGRQTRRINHLINDLLDVTQIRAGKLALHPSNIDLAELTRTAVEDCQGQLQDAHCAVQMDIQPAPGRWDASRVSQIITNLLTNVSKYAGGSAVHIQVTAQDGQAKLEVEDHGTGIPGAVLPRIFLPFERNNSSRAVAGLGLGLYICQRIARAHGGDIAVKSAVGQGTTFTLSLPQ